MNRTLPMYEIDGTQFIVDINRFLLFEKEDPQNILFISDMKDLKGGGYSFDYDRDLKNMPIPWENSAHVISVSIPELKDLDPGGMARKYGLSAADFSGKSDFDIMVDQEAYQRRLSGVLPTLDILGYPFYVDLRMGILRPKDDLSFGGISFSEIASYFFEDSNSYIIPYNPGTHKFQELDYNRITEIPKDIVAIEFSHEYFLDRIGYNRKYKMEDTMGLKKYNVKMEHQSQVVPWSKVGLDELVRDNLSRYHEMRLEAKDQKKEVKFSLRGKGGRRR